MRLRAPSTAGPYGIEPAVHFDFLSADEVFGQNLVLYPLTNRPPVSGGMTTNGSTQYATFNLANYTVVFGGGAPGEISIYCEFIPEFDYAEAVTRSIWDSTTVNYAAQREATAPDYVLRFWLGNFTIVCSVPCATYGPLWRTNARNKTLVAGVSGANRAYLNGTLISSTATAWSRSAVPPQLYFSMTPGVTFPFDGTTVDYRVFNRQLNAAECVEMTTL
jgi:hypothetical protein